MREHSTIFVDGRWIPSTGTDTIDVFNPAEELVGRVPAGTVQDIERAVRAARTAFEPWSQTPSHQRADYLKRHVRRWWDWLEDDLALLTQAERRAD